MTVSCQEHAQHAMEYVLGMLEPEKTRALRAHLASGCPACAGAVAEAETVVAKMGESVTRVSPGAGLKKQVLDRVRAEGRPAVAGRVDARGVSRVEAGSGRRWWHVALASAAAAAVVGAALVGFYQPKLTATRQQLGASETKLALATQARQDASAKLAQMADELAARERSLSRAQNELAAATQNLRVMQARNLKLVALKGMGPSPQASAHLFWDKDTHGWCLVTHGLPQTSAKKTYELWLISKSNGKMDKIPAGTFDVDAKGEGVLRIRMPAHPGTPMLAAVTEEPAGGVQTPTGQIRLMGHLE